MFLEMGAPVLEMSMAAFTTFVCALSAVESKNGLTALASSLYPKPLTMAIIRLLSCRGMVWMRKLAIVVGQPFSRTRNASYSNRRTTNIGRQMVVAQANKSLYLSINGG